MFSETVFCTVIKSGDYLAKGFTNPLLQSHINIRLFGKGFAYFQNIVDKGGDDYYKGF